MSVEDAFGQMDLYRLLEDSHGLVSFELYDSGTLRTGECRYAFSLKENDKLEVWPAASSATKLTLNRYVPLKPHTVAFVGLYIGDGAKASHPGSAGIISFSQRESRLANFVRSHFIQLFGDSLTFTHRVNEDALFFMTDKMRQALGKLRDQLLAEGRTDILSREQLEDYLKRDLDSVIAEQAPATRIALEKHSRKAALQKHRKYLVEFFANRSIMNEYLKRLKLKELTDSGTPLSENDRIAVNIRLPGVKGAREEGKSSRSDELDVDGLRQFHALFLRILSDVQSSIEKNEEDVKVSGSSAPWLIWEGKPHDCGKFSIQTVEYLTQAEECGRFSRRRLVRYNCREEGQTLVISIGKSCFKVPKTLRFTPLLCLFFGLYLAEGQTPKWKIFKLAKEPVGSLKIGFTASEPDSVSVCMRGMKQLIAGENTIPEYWRIKVGAKYFPETVTIGNKIGTVALRRGEKGQGAASGFEIVENLRHWAVKSMPVLGEIESRFDHVEYTGAGIPRIDLFYPKGPEIYIFSLMRDLISNPSALNRFSVELGGANR
jgi:hypothetical protein